LDNLVPMNSNLNRDTWKTMENSWAEALANGKEVTVSIEAVYEG
jgi:DNA/RNA non-specific endonuclease.